MFSKLLKHEWKANWGLMSVLALAVIGVALVGTIALRVLVNYGDMISESDSVLVLLLFPLGMLVFVSFLALAIYAVAVSFVMIFRFYKNKFTDEGYLTFTLPVKTSQIFLSSALNMLIWMVISVVLVAVLFVVMILCGTATDGIINMDIINGFKEMDFIWQELSLIYGEIMGEGFGVLSVITMLVSPIYSVVLSMTCITLGAVVAKKHKILAAIGISYGASMILSIISSVVTSVPSLLFIGDTSMESSDLYFTLTMVGQLLIYVGVIVGGYFLSTHLMKNKLNLP
jgi:hypothetical protein